MPSQRRLTRIGSFVYAPTLSNYHHLCTRYDFIAYNASIVFWEIARLLHREGYHKHVLAPAKRVVESLQAIRSGDVEAHWLIKNLL